MAPGLGDGPDLRVAHDEEVAARDAGDGDPADLVRVHAGLHERRELRRRLLWPAEPRLPGPARVPDLRPHDARAEDADSDPVRFELAAKDVGERQDGVLRRGVDAHAGEWDADAVLRAGVEDVRRPAGRDEARHEEDRKSVVEGTSVRR